MATVKGDVHDIGKNIVGVVLGCNDYEIIDLGVMVPCETILDDGAREKRRHDRPLRPDHAVARRDGPRRAGDGARRASSIPLLIGGATTSRQHTAVKIAPGYQRADGPRPRRLARASAWSSSLLRPRAEARARPREPRRAGATCRELYAQRQSRPLVPYAEALRPRARRSTGGPSDVPSPAFLGTPRRSTTSRSRELVPYIDWSSFFLAWELKGKYPEILDDPRVGASRARPLRRARRTLLDSASSTRSCCARAASTASSRRTRDGDDIVVFTDETRQRRGCALPHAAAAGDQDEGQTRLPQPGRLRRAGRVRASPTTSAPSP